MTGDLVSQKKEGKKTYLNIIAGSSDHDMHLVSSSPIFQSQPFSHLCQLIEFKTEFCFWVCRLYITNLIRLAKPQRAFTSKPLSSHHRLMVPVRVFTNKTLSFFHFCHISFMLIKTNADQNIEHHVTIPCLASTFSKIDLKVFLWL